MIYRFREIIPNVLYRGSAPTPRDVFFLKNKYNINKIISLDYEDGKKISKACKMLGVEQVLLPIGLDDVYSDLFKIFKYNLRDLLLIGGPTFIHCHAGKDRTGLLSALFKCKYMGMDPEEAIEEAESLDFGIGLDPKITNLFKKLIRSCKPENDNFLEQNSGSNIVSNQREYISDNKSSFLDESRQGSFAPYLTPTRQYPIDALYSYINDQSPTRENYDREVQKGTEHDVVPLVGVFDNNGGVRGFGPTEPASGFIYD